MKHFLLVRKFYPVAPDGANEFEPVYEDPLIRELLGQDNINNIKEVDAGLAVYNVDHIVGISQHTDPELSIIEINSASIFVIVCHTLEDILSALSAPNKQDIVNDNLIIINDLVGDISTKTDENKFRLWSDDFRSILVRNGVTGIKPNTYEMFFKSGLTPFDAYKETQRKD